MNQKEEDSFQPRNWQALMAQLVSEDWRERQEAVEQLSSMNNLELARGVLEIVRRSHADLNALSAGLQVLERVGRPLTNEIAALMNEPDRDLRIYIPLLLGELGDPQAIPALMGLLEDEGENENVCFNAIEALGKLRSVEAMDVLMNILGDSSPYLRYAAVIALGQIGRSEPASQIMDLLEDPYLGEPAVTALGMIGDAQAVGRIVQWMKAGSAHDAITAVSAIAEAGRRAESAVRSVLLEVVDLDSQRILINFIEAAPHLDSSGVADDARPASVTDAWWGDLALVLGWLVESEKPIEPPLLRALSVLMLYPAARPAAEAALRSAGEQARGPLCDVLMEKIRGEMGRTQPDDLYMAARLLAEMGAAEATPVFLEMLDSDLETLAVLAAEGLGKIGTPQAVDALFGQLGAASAQVRRAAAAALAAQTSLTGPVRERIDGLMASADANERESALRLAAAYDPAGNAEWITAAFSDPAANVRQAALDLLPILDHLRAVTILTAALEDEDAGVRTAAARAAAELPADQALPLLNRAVGDANMWVRMHALRGLGKHALPESAEVLSGAVMDPAVPVRIAAVEALEELALRAEGVLAEGRLVEALQGRIEDEQEDAAVRRAAQSVLNRIRQEGTGGFGAIEGSGGMT
jgi:HEAT repeat protein